MTTPFLAIDFGTKNISTASLDADGLPVLLSYAVAPWFPDIEKNNYADTLKNLAATHHVQEVFLAFPAGADSEQQKVFTSAVEQAGLKLGGLVADTTAAALAYGVLKKKKGTALVYHLGAGYFGAAVVSYKTGASEILAAAGGHKFAGNGVDKCIVQNLSDEIRLSGADAPSEQFLQTLRTEAEKAKTSLSHRGSYDLRSGDEASGVKLNRALSRYELEQWIGSQLDYTIDLCLQVLQRAKIEPSQVEEILLSGGSSRLPWVHKLIEARFQKKPVSEITPEHIVVLGTAARAGILKGQLHYQINEK